MGMMLRRRDRKADRNPTVNGKPVKQEPKKKSLTEKQNSEDRVRTTQYR
jgi:hypothetical protein